jgi:hypothetical protein
VPGDAKYNVWLAQCPDGQTVRMEDALFGIIIILGVASYYANRFYDSADHRRYLWALIGGLCFVVTSLGISIGIGFLPLISLNMIPDADSRASVAVLTSVASSVIGLLLGCIITDRVKKRYLPTIPSSSLAMDLVSFCEPMSFPKGTTLFETKGPRVAVLPDYSLIMDEGGLGGRAFESASEYREQTGDRDQWNEIKTF